MLSQPASRRIPATMLLRQATTCGVWPVRTWDPSLDEVLLTALIFRSAPDQLQRTLLQLAHQSTLRLLDSNALALRL